MQKYKKINEPLKVHTLVNNGQMYTQERHHLLVKVDTCN